jgi:polar amino acid transport system substrate-binding protein
MRVLLPLLAIACVLLTACGGRDGAPDRLAAAKARGVLTVGVKADAAPFGVQTRTGLSGFDVDIATAVANQLGCEVRLVPVTSADRIPRLQSGELDLVVATTTITRGRERQVDFSIPYFQDGQALLVRTGSPITGYKDLAGKRVAAVRGSTSVGTLRQVAPEAEVVELGTMTDIKDALLAERVDAITSDGFILMGLRQGEKRLSFAGPRFSTEPYGIAMAQGQSALRDAVNEALMDLWESGQWRAIYDAWFGPGTAYQADIRFAVPVVPR